MGRKARIPAETLLSLRKRLETLPARAPERRQEVDRVAELFDVDDMGTAILKVEGEIPPELHEKAHLCADNCPEYAITVEE